PALRASETHPFDGARSLHDAPCTTAGGARLVASAGVRCRRARHDRRGSLPPGSTVLRRIPPAPLTPILWSPVPGARRLGPPLRRGSARADVDRRGTPMDERSDAAGERPASPRARAGTDRGSAT